VKALGGYHRLSEDLRAGLVHSLRWRSLRPVQEESIDAILDGHNTLILAPTAGGKTEAALLPVIEALSTHRGRGPGALYLSPLRALLNNQEERVGRLAGLVGLRAFKWHGDVGADRRRRFLEDPAEILMITPESLEVILVGPRYDKPALFAHLSHVIVDEVHAFAGDDRGDHLIALLERLGEYARGDLQRIGLSATVGDPEVLLTWLAGSSRRPGRIVQPERVPSRRVIEIHPLSEGEDPAPRAAALARGKKSLLFAESRHQVEKLKAGLEDFGIRAFVHHSSVSRELRERAEEAFRSGSNCCIVCTSTLELGLDVGDLDLVLQLHAPATVSAFLQRLGRTGRRPGTRGHLAFLTDEEWTFLVACALVRLGMEGWIEPVRPSRRSAHVFVHQVLARILQHGGVPRPRLVDGCGKPYCFADLSRSERAQILDHLVATDILTEVDSLLTFGQEGERQFGFANFRSLYSVFDSPAQLVVRTTGNVPVGTLEAWFAQALGQDRFCFVLGGQAWVAVECDWEKGVLTVAPAPRGKYPSWTGSPRLLSREVCQTVRGLLLEKDPLPYLGPQGLRALERLRRQWGELLRPAPLVAQKRGGELFLYTFAGGRINNVLGKVLERECKVEVSIGNFWVRARGLDFGPLETSLERLRSGSYISEGLVDDLVSRLPRGRLSRFQPFLPESLERRLMAERLLDLEGAAEVAGWQTSWRTED
jgi:ATP-dependent Lhr-like helicase